MTISQELIAAVLRQQSAIAYLATLREMGTPAGIAAAIADRDLQRQRVVGLSQIIDEAKLLFDRIAANGFELPAEEAP